MKRHTLLASVSLVLILTGCTATTTDTANSKAASVDFSSLLIDANRPAEDAKDDANRKPEAVMNFMGVSSGQTIFEMEAGGGYYTELFSKAVGTNGKVYMQNPQGFDGFLGDTDDKRLAENRLPNVEYVRTQFDNLPAETASVDIVSWFLGPHEIYFVPEGTEGFGDASKTYAEIARILKDDGVFIAIDHVAPEGSGKQAGQDLHRIEQSIIVEEAKAVGLELVESSTILENLEDPLSISPFDPSVRRKTHRFLLKFKKSN